MSEYNAMTQLAKSAPEARRELIQEQNRIYLEQQLEYSSTKKAAFLKKVRQVLTLIAIAIIAYVLFHFAGAGHVA